MHGARELGLTIRDYFAGPESVAEAQLRMQARYGHDCLYAFFYASIELEAWGGETIYGEDGPPNAGSPIVRRSEDILVARTAAGRGRSLPSPCARGHLAPEGALARRPDHRRRDVALLPAR